MAHLKKSLIQKAGDPNGNPLFDPYRQKTFSLTGN